MLKPVTDCNKNKKMCSKAVDNCVYSLGVAYKICPDCYKICNKAVSNDPFMIKYCLDRYKAQEMCDKAVDDFLPALKFVPNWFVISKMVKKLDHVLFANDDILFFDEDSGNVTFYSDEIDINTFT